MSRLPNTFLICCICAEELENMECLRKLCEICDENDRIYKCPRCGTGTCSLQCCKLHKQKTGCDGKRDKTAYVPVSQFKAETLKSDYHFLEDVLQTRQSAKRKFEVDCGGEQKGQNFNNKRPRFHGDAKEVLPVQSLKLYNQTAKLLVKQAKERGLSVLLQPQGMSKRRENTSRYDKRGNAIVWQITLVFLLETDFSMPDLLSYDAALKKLSPKDTNRRMVGFHVKDVRDSVLVGDMLKQVLSSLPSGSLLSHILRPLRDCQDLHVLIRKMPSPANDPLFCEMNLQDSLHTNLNGHQVVEFPTLVVCRAASLSRFRLMVSNCIDPQQRGETNDQKIRVIDSKEDEPMQAEATVSLGESTGDDAVSAVDAEEPVMELSLQPIGDNGIGATESSEMQQQSTTGNIGQEEEDGEIIDDDVDNETEKPGAAREDGEEEEDEGYEEFMKNLVHFQTADIKTLKQIIQNEKLE